ncbi:MAG: radical SAM protein [Deltaproteobacteria bacterium]|nr:radical SAM protein [Deltaproteobacteria bacterium]
MHEETRNATCFPSIARIRRDRGVVKLCLELRDGAFVESVLIPMRTRPRGDERLTLCLSTQVGCRMGCAFCATGRMGFVRDLEPDEIVAQAEIAERVARRPDKLVFMGMGEPLDNLERWREAVRLLTVSRRVGDRPPFAWSTKDMTLSTAGHVDGLDRLAPVFPRKMTLAVSLNAPNDELRSRLMPLNRRWPLAVLREALSRFPLRNRTFLAEYVVFRDLNDGEEHARELAAYLSPFRTLVNLIAYNPPASGGPDWLAAPTAAQVERFRRLLGKHGQVARCRETKGRRIEAACGQLATGTRRD